MRFDTLALFTERDILNSILQTAQNAWHLVNDLSVYREEMGFNERTLRITALAIGMIGSCAFAAALGLSRFSLISLPYALGAGICGLVTWMALRQLPSRQNFLEKWCKGEIESHSRIGTFNNQYAPIIPQGIIDLNPPFYNCHTSKRSRMGQDT